MSNSEITAAINLAIAALIGLGVGLEREWSGHATGPQARFAGLRTFLMLGLLGGCGGLLLSEGHEIAAAVLVTGGIGFSVAAYVMTVRRPGAETDGTTEGAAILVVALGLLAGSGLILIAAGTGSVVVLALNEKTRLHGAVRHVRQEELRAALQFFVLALVVLPLLPAGPFLGILQIEPRTVWIIVLFFSALNFAAFLARRAVGRDRGYEVAGMLGGLISSTGVTFNFSRRSWREPKLVRALSFGVIGACTVLIPRVLVVSSVLNTRVAISLLPFLVPTGLLGALALFIGWRSAHSRGAEPQVATADDSEAKSPLNLAAAIRMAVAFQVAMSAIAYVRSMWSTGGVYTTAALLGLTDVDALTVSMSRQLDGLAPNVAARAISIGVLANTLMKLTLVLVLGSAMFRRVAGTTLALMGLASALMLWAV